VSVQATPDCAQAAIPRERHRANRFAIANPPGSDPETSAGFPLQPGLNYRSAIFLRPRFTRLLQRFTCSLNQHAGSEPRDSGRQAPQHHLLPGDLDLLFRFGFDWHLLGDCFLRHRQRDLKDPALEAGLHFVGASPLRQTHPALEGSVRNLAPQIVFLLDLLLAPAFPFDSQDVAQNADLDVFGLKAGYIGANDQVPILDVALNGRNEEFVLLVFEFLQKAKWRFPASRNPFEFPKRPPR